MKKSPDTPDVNANAPRPRRVSTEDSEVPTMDVPPKSPADTATGFDRATAAVDQDRRAGLLPGSDRTTATEFTVDEDEADLEPYDKLEPGADLEPDFEFDPEDEFADRDVSDPPAGIDPVFEANLQIEPQTFPQQDDADQEGLLHEESGRANKDHPANPNHEEIQDVGNDTLGAAKPSGKRRK